MVKYGGNMKKGLTIFTLQLSITTYKGGLDFSFEIYIGVLSIGDVETGQH